MKAMTGYELYEHARRLQAQYPGSDPWPAWGQVPEDIRARWERNAVDRAAKLGQVLE